MKYFYLLFFSFSMLAQNQPLKIVIENIQSIDSLNFRKYVIDYSIMNITNNKISFFLHPENVFDGSYESMSNNISSNLFQEKEELPMYLILSHTSKRIGLPEGFEKLPEGKEKDEILKKYLKEVLGIDFDKELEELKKNDDETYRLKKSSKKLMESIMTLEPFEQKKYTKIFYWDKNRYYKIDELEYYINENSNCFLELYIVLLKEQFKAKMTDDDFKTLSNIPNFVEGWFSSNKMEINFRE